jgi:hypothetical protein
MDMISHQHIGVDLTAMLFAGRLKLFQIKMVIRIATENLGTIVTANNNMLRLAGNNHSCKASHGLNLQISKVNSLASFFVHNQWSLTL